MPMRAAALPLSLLLLAASAASAQTKPEDAIKYRQAQYTVLLWNWMPLNAMVRGRIPFDAAEFARRAQLVAAVAPQLLEGFPEGSGTGAPTEAKPEIWTNFADFSAKMKDLERETAALATVAKGGDEAAIKAQFALTGGTCKACHDEYKVD
jgi:cytochrome c556